MFRYLILLFILVATGCSPSYTLKKVYEGPQKTKSEIAIVYIDPHVIVLRIDQTQESFGNGGRKVLAGSAGILRESIALLPGHHVIEAQFSLPGLHSVGTQELVFNAEPGKEYRLKSEVIDSKIWKASIVEYHGEAFPKP